MRRIRKDLLLKILTEVSKWEHGEIHDLEIPGCSSEEIKAHIGYLFEEGMLHARAYYHKNGTRYIPRSLTVQGYTTLSR